MLSGRGLCDELITRPEESYRLCCVVVCDLETSRMGAPYIYDISRLRVNLLVPLTSTGKFNRYFSTICVWQAITTRTKVHALNPYGHKANPSFLKLRLRSLQTSTIFDFSYEGQDVIHDVDRFNNCYIMFSLQGWSINRTELEFLFLSSRKLSSMSQKHAASIFRRPNYIA